MRGRPGRRRIAILVRGGEPVLRRAAVLDRENQAPGPLRNQPAEAFMRFDAAEHVPAGVEEHDQRWGFFGVGRSVEACGNFLAGLPPRYRQILGGADRRLRVEVPLPHEIFDMTPGVGRGHIGYLRHARPVEIGEHEGGLRIELLSGLHRRNSRYSSPSTAPLLSTPSWSAQADHPRLLFSFSARANRKKPVDGRPAPTMTGG